MPLINNLAKVQTSETHCQENCAEAVKLAVKKAGYNDEIFTVSCTETRKNLRNSKEWEVVTDKKYERNDIILFDWDNSGDCDHIGIVRQQIGDTIYYDDFNSGTSPRMHGTNHMINVDNLWIAGVFRHWIINHSQNIYHPIDVNVHSGDEGSIVKLIQAIVETVPDGMYGANTREAVMVFQKNNDCEVDGVVGKETFNAMANYLINKYPF